MEELASGKYMYMSLSYLDEVDNPLLFQALRGPYRFPLFVRYVGRVLTLVDTIILQRCHEHFEHFFHVTYEAVLRSDNE